MKFLVIFVLVLISMLLWHKYQNSRNRKGSIIHAISRKGFRSNDAIEIYKKNESYINSMMNEGLSDSQIIKNIICTKVANSHKEDSINSVSDFFKKPTFLYILLTTILLILIELFTDGSGTYTGGGFSENLPVYLR